MNECEAHLVNFKHLSYFLLIQSGYTLHWRVYGKGKPLYARILPCGRVVAVRRRGAAPPGDEVLRGHGGEQQRELQHRRGRELRHDCAAVTWRRKRASGGCDRCRTQI